jgi:DNA repair protein RadC
MGLAQDTASVTASDASASPASLLAAVLEPGAPRTLCDLAEQVLAGGLQAFSDPGAGKRAEALGFTRDQAARLCACAALVARLEAEGWAMPPPICGPADVLAHLGDIRDAIQERVVALYVDSRNRPLRRETIAVGGLRASVITPRDVIGPALTMPASGLILAHNHPSGDTRPSVDDVEVTLQLAAAGKLFGIELIDHLVVSRRGYCSLKEMGKM